MRLVAASANDRAPEFHMFLTNAEELRIPLLKAGESSLGGAIFLDEVITTAEFRQHSIFDNVRLVVRNSSVAQPHSLSRWKPVCALVHRLSPIIAC